MDNIVISKQKSKAFVRPNCSTTFWLNCPVCTKRYFKSDSHMDCFARWCELCQESFSTQRSLIIHGQKYHSKQFCHECNNIFANIKGHNDSNHVKSTKNKDKKELKEFNQTKEGLDFLLH